MEIREGSVIISVDKQVDERSKEFIEKFAWVLSRMVDENNNMLWDIAADGIARTVLAVKFFKDVLGERSE